MRSFVIYIESYFSVSLIVLHSPKMRGGGGVIVLSVQKDGRGNVHPLLYCRRGNALTLPKIGGESSYLADLSRGGNVQGGGGGGKCPDTNLNVCH